MARLLLIDDDSTLLEVLTLAFEDAGHAVQTALDGAAGLRAVADGGVELVISDVNMPLVDGFALCRKLRGAGSDLPIEMIRRVPAAKRRHALRIVGDGHDTPHVRILDAARETPLLDQPLRRIALAGGGHRHCPLPPAEKDRSQPTVLDAALRLAGQDSSDATPQPAPRSDTPSTPCALDPAPIDGDRDLHAWDGRAVRLMHGLIAPALGFRSAGHAALVVLRRIDATGNHALQTEATVQIHDRASLHARSGVTRVHECQAPHCDAAAADFVEGVRFDDRTITVATTAGDWTFPR